MLIYNTMALPFSHTSITIPRSQIGKSRNRDCLCRSSKKLTEASVSFCKFNGSIKVYEDRANGVVCFRNEKGEVVCEGLDEGPRFDRPASSEKGCRFKFKSFRSIASCSSD